METVEFLQLDLVNVSILFVIGFVGGLVSGFIGSGGAFVLTPAMMSLGVPGIVAVASNMAHKFPKAMVGAIKRHRFGQVDVKLGVIMGLFAEAGVFAGKELMTAIHESFGAVGTDLYVSAVFVAVLSIVGGFVLRDALRGRERARRGEEDNGIPRLACWAQSVHVRGTMVQLRSVGKPVSLLIMAPLGFATGLLAASIAVGGFIGVPAMIYVLGVPAIMATASELVVAFVMGLGGSLFYALEGFVDIRLSMIILGGSLFGIQLGAVGTTYVRDHTIKFVMGAIMILVLFSRLVKLPEYIAELGMIEALPPARKAMLDSLSFDILIAALLFGAGAITIALAKGMLTERKRLIAHPDEAATD